MPTWLPDGILKIMNDHFASELRKELLLFMSEAQQIRHIKSVDSGNLSGTEVIPRLDESDTESDY